MKLQIDDHNRVIGFASIGEIVGGIDFSGEIPADFQFEFYKYRMIGSNLIKDTGMISDIEQESIRIKRERDCFPVINRGTPWYKRLSDEQLSELEEWYQLWLDAPATGITPDQPTWLH